MGEEEEELEEEEEEEWSEGKEEWREVERSKSGGETLEEAWRSCSPQNWKPA